MKEFLLNILPINDREDMPKPIYVIKKLLAFLLCLFGAGIIAEVIVIAAMMIAGKDPLNGGSYGIEASIVTLLILAAGCVLLMVCGKKVSK